MADVSPVALGVHGGLLHSELTRLGLEPAEILDCSVNVNPYGPCPTLLDAIRAAPLDRYPDPTGLPARLALSAALRQPPDRLVLANGAVELLWSLARACLKPGDTVLIVEPAFSELRRAALHLGCRIVEHRLQPTADFAFALSAFAAALSRERPRLVYLACPGNPTGRIPPLAEVLELADQHTDAQFVVDLSFLSLSSAPELPGVHASERVAWLHSLTKDLALPGLRVGFALLPTALARAVEASRPPWSTSAPAQAALMASTRADVRAFVAQSRERLLADRAELERQLASLGLQAHPSETIYSLLQLGTGRSAHALRATLLEQHAILIRDASSFGLPNHVRICAQPAARAERLFSALRAVLA